MRSSRNCQVRRPCMVYKGNPLDPGRKLALPDREIETILLPPGMDSGGSWHIALIVEKHWMRLALTWMSALLLCGCLGRAKPDLLQARLREQQEQTAELERQVASTQADLQRAS